MKSKKTEAGQGNEKREADKEAETGNKKERSGKGK